MKEEMTIKQMALAALEELGHRATTKEMVEVIDKHKWYKGEGKTLWDSLSAQMCTDLRDNADSPFWRDATPDGIFGLKKWCTPEELKIFDEFRQTLLKKKADRDKSKAAEKSTQSKEKSVQNKEKTVNVISSHTQSSSNSERSAITNILMHECFGATTDKVIEDFKNRRNSFNEYISRNVADAAIFNEEQTKHSFIMPMLNALGYDIFNASEVKPEFTADVGVKEGEKVDYAIFDTKGNIRCIIECKKAGVKLGKQHWSQLFRYYSVTQCPLAILTNGLDYQLYADLNKNNVLDEEPFVSFNVLNDPDLLTYLIFLSKSYFNIDYLVSFSERQKTGTAVLDYIRSNMENPSDDLVKFILQAINVRVSKKSLAANKAVVSLALRSVSSNNRDSDISMSFKDAVKAIFDVISKAVPNCSIIKDTKPFGMKMSIYIKNDKKFGIVSISNDAKVIIFDKCVEGNNVDRFEYSSVVEFTDALSAMLVE